MSNWLYFLRGQFGSISLLFSLRGFLALFERLYELLHVDDKAPL
jgi:hypothetical protein